MYIREEIREDVAVLKLSGKLMSWPDVAPIHDRVKELVREGVCRVVVDLSEVKWFGAAMLGVLAAGLQTMQAAGGDLWLTSVSKKMEHTLSVTGLSKVFQMPATVEWALKGVQKESDLDFRAEAPETERPRWVVPSGDVQQGDSVPVSAG